MSERAKDFIYNVIIFGIVIFICILGVRKIGNSYFPVNLINCQSYLAKAEEENKKAYSDSGYDYWNLDAVYNLNRYEICRRYGE